MNELCIDIIRLMDNASVMALLLITVPCHRKPEERIPLSAVCKFSKEMNFGVFYWTL